jgi:hypothetical protein
VRLEVSFGQALRGDLQISILFELRSGESFPERQILLTLPFCRQICATWIDLTSRAVHLLLQLIGSLLQFFQTARLPPEVFLYSLRQSLSFPGTMLGVSNLSLDSHELGSLMSVAALPCGHGKLTLSSYAFSALCTPVSAFFTLSAAWAASLRASP